MDAFDNPFEAKRRQDAVPRQRGRGAGHAALFLSHSGADTEDARELKRRLEASPNAEAGLEVWFDKDDLRPGQGWQAHQRA